MPEERRAGGKGAQGFVRFKKRVQMRFSDMSRSIVPNRALRRGGGVRFEWVWAILLCAPALIGSTVRATVIRDVSFERLCEKSGPILVGTVTDRRCTRSARGMIYTAWTFHVDQWIAGADLGEDTITLRVPGGSLDGERLTVHGTPKFDVGGRYVVFLRRGKRSLCPVLGWTQGCFRVLEDGSSDPPVADYHGRRIADVRRGKVVLTVDQERETQNPAEQVGASQGDRGARGAAGPETEAMTLSRLVEQIMRLRSGLDGAADSIDADGPR